MNESSHNWELTGGRALEWGGSPLVMGILNVTPDSFSDGGADRSVDDAVERALEMTRNGASIIDVGGESTRPGADPVPAGEERSRTVPVIEKIRRESTVAISIDTMKAEVAEAALEAGADIINDVTALRGDEEMVEVAARTGAPLILMHMRGTPRTMQQDPTYTDVVGEILSELDESIGIAERAGIPRDRIWIDPGIGFAKTADHNVEIMARLERLVAHGPVLLGASRKSFIAAITRATDPADRLGGSLAAVARGADAGVVAVRVHDVAETSQFLAVRAALAAGEMSG